MIPAPKTTLRKYLYSSDHSPRAPLDLPDKLCNMNIHNLTKRSRLQPCYIRLKRLIILEPRQQVRFIDCSLIWGMNLDSATVGVVVKD